MPDQDETLRIHLLNGFRLELGERRLEAGTLRLRKARDLLKLLALAEGHRLHREQLMEQLWPDDDPDSAAHNLHQTLYSLRKALHSLGADPQACLVYEEGLLRLCPDSPLWVDVDAFAEAARRARKNGSLADYQAALGLYTGELLPEDRYQDWANQRREALQRAYHELLLGLARQHEARGEHQSAIEVFQRILSGDPYWEEAHVGMMRLYALTGQRQQALRTYHSLAENLMQELQVEPAPETRQVYERILSGELGIERKEPVWIQPERERHNLPQRLSSFVGRVAEMREVKGLLARHRLVTLVGTGGMGKSRLGLEIAWDVWQNYPDGAWLA